MRVNVRDGSWLCENTGARATRRNISEQLHLRESNHTAHARFDALLKNCVFYISWMYEFLHRVIHDPRSPGHTTVRVRFTPKATIADQNLVRRLVPIADIAAIRRTGFM